MSSEAETAASVDTCCASCGTAAVDEIKLKDCDDCGLVKYCSDRCRGLDRPGHDRLCRKRLAEIDSLLKQPKSSYLGDCPICCLPLSIDLTKSTSMTCCTKIICNGCHYANRKREKEAGLGQRCAFCREPLPKTQQEADKNTMERVKKNCPIAMVQMGRKHFHEGDYKSALEYYTKAAEFGDARAHHHLSIMYEEGQGVNKDYKKKVYHAAIGGHTASRYNLGIFEGRNGSFERSRKHFIIAANLGFHDSLNCLKELYADGNASKEDYASALRAYQAAVDATKSEEREKAEEAIKNGEWC